MEALQECIRPISHSLYQHRSIEWRVRQPPRRRQIVAIDDDRSVWSPVDAVCAIQIERRQYLL
jgi:hypothetical protein